MILYLYEGQEHRGLFGEPLIKKSLGMYASEKNLRIPGEIIIARTEAGKPYFANLPLFFSVSHTEDLWGCIIAEQNVGVDLQAEKKVRHGEVAERFFTEEEQKFVAQYGASGFFDIWVHKEAVIKFLGTGIAQDIRTFSVVSEGRILDKITIRDRDCVITSSKIRAGIKGAYCSEREEELWIRKIN